VQSQQCAHQQVPLQNREPIFIQFGDNHGVKVSPVIIRVSIRNRSPNPLRLFQFDLPVALPPWTGSHERMSRQWRRSQLADRAQCLCCTRRVCVFRPECHSGPPAPPQRYAPEGPARRMDHPSIMQHCHRGYWPHKRAVLSMRHPRKPRLRFFGDSGPSVTQGGRGGIFQVITLKLDPSGERWGYLRVYISGGGPREH
jgi:hypothetical protein